MLPCFEARFSFLLAALLFSLSSHTLLDFDQSHLLCGTLLTRLLADAINLHIHIKHSHWSREKDKPELSSPPCFSASLHWLFFISSNAVSLPWSTNRKHGYENAVLMFSVLASLVLSQTLTGHCNGLVSNLKDFRHIFLLRPSLYESHSESVNSDQAWHKVKV